MLHGERGLAFPRTTQTMAHTQAPTKKIIKVRCQEAHEQDEYLSPASQQNTYQRVLVPHKHKGHNCVHAQAQQSSDVPHSKAMPKWPRQRSSYNAHTHESISNTEPALHSLPVHAVQESRRTQVLHDHMGQRMAVLVDINRREMPTIVPTIVRNILLLSR